MENGHKHETATKEQHADLKTRDEDQQDQPSYARDFEHESCVQLSHTGRKRDYSNHDGRRQMQHAPPYQSCGVNNQSNYYRSESRNHALAGGDRVVTKV